MQLFLFIFYFILVSYLFYSFHSNKESGLSPTVLQILFTSKIAAGIINLYLHNNVFANSDAAFYYWQALEELKNASNDPASFLREWLFNWGDFSGRLNFLKRENTPYWSNLGSLFHGKFMTLSNILSFGNIYVNVIFYNAFFFIGQLLLYKSFYSLQPNKKWLLVFSVFLVPSVLFWCSGIHKDGWVLAAIGFLCYYTLKNQDEFKPKYLAIILISFFFILIIRYFYFICILPPYLLWILTRKSTNRISLFTISYAVFILIFLFYGYIDAAHNPMLLIVNKQKDFLALNGISDIELHELSPNAISFLQNLPTAIYHVFLLPIFDINSPLRYQLASLDSIFVLAVVLLSFIHVRKQHLSNSFFLFTLFFSLTVYLFIGYTIPNSGALVRYKSEFTAILLPTLLCVSEIPLLNKRIETLKNRINLL